jgi:hypothetical protein
VVFGGTLMFTVFVKVLINKVAARDISTLFPSALANFHSKMDVQAYSTEGLGTNTCVKSWNNIGITCAGVIRATMMNAL